jgi:hypothetical protein
LEYPVSLTVPSQPGIAPFISSGNIRFPGKTRYGRMLEPVAFLHELTMKLYYNFIKRWPELHAVKPSSLSELRAKSASPACIKKEKILLLD